MRTAKGFAILVALLLSEEGHSESLEDAWKTALAVDHGLRATHLTTESVEERLGAASSRRLPTLNVEGGYVSKSDPSIVDISELNLADVEHTNQNNAIYDAALAGLRLGRTLGEL